MNANPLFHVTELMSGKGHSELTAVPSVAVGIAVAAVAWFNPSQAAAATVVSPAIAVQPGIGLHVDSKGQPSGQPALFGPDLGGLANPCSSGALGVRPAPQSPPEQQPGRQPGQGPALTGSFNYDGTVLLSDGRIMNSDGTFKPVDQVIHPPDSTKLPDGGVRHPDGKIFNADGTERKPIYGYGFMISPDGSVLDANRECLLSGSRVRHNYDGTVTLVDAQGVQVVGMDGRPAGEPVLGRVNPDGSVTTLDGRTLNADGSERKTITLPDGGVLSPDGTTTPGR
jgi:hypothetical protein